MSTADVNGDGHRDVIAAVTSSEWNDETLEIESLVLVFHGSATGLPSGGIASAATRLESPSFFGFQAVSGAGDVNGDGYDDLIASDPSDEAVYVFHGSATGVPSGGVEVAAATLIEDESGIRLLERAFRQPAT